MTMMMRLLVVCLLACVAASPAAALIVPAAITTVTLYLPSSGVFYVGSSSSVTWTSDFEARIGGASLVLDCGENVVVTNSPQCLSQSGGTFLVVGEAADSTGIACTATVIGAQAVSYTTVSGASYVATTALVPVVAQTAVSVSPVTSASSPYTSYQTDIVTVTLTPAAVTPAGADVSVSVLCTSASGVWTTTVEFVAGSSDAVEYSYTLSAVGGATCSHTYSSSAQQPFASIADVFFKSQSQTPLVVSGQPIGFNDLSAAHSFALSVANSLAATDDDLTVQLTCSSTGVTGANATDSVGNAASIVMKAGGEDASFLINTPAISTGALAKVACAFTLGSTPSPFVFSSSSASFQFQVGTEATFTVSGIEAALEVYPLEYTWPLYVTPTSGTVIDTNVTVTPVCYQNGVALPANVYLVALTFTTDTAQPTSFESTTSLAVGIVQCKFTISGSDALHFAPIPDVNITVLLLPGSVLGVPTSLVSGSPTAATEFNITVLNPQLIYPYSVSVCLTCIGDSSVGEPTLVGASDGTTIQSATMPASVYFPDGSSTVNAFWQVTVPALASAEASNPVTCIWTLGNSKEAMSAAAFESFSFTVGTLQTLTTSPALATGESAIPVVVGSSTTITINSAAGIINTNLIITADCSVCGNTGLGTTGATAGDNDVEITLLGTFPSDVSGNEFTFLATGTGIVECSFALSGFDAAHFAQPPNVVFNVTAAPPATVTPAKEFEITVTGGLTITSATASTDSVISTPTVIAPTGSDQTYTVTVASPGVTVLFGLLCTQNGDSMTVTAAGGGRAVTSGAIEFTTDSTADANFTFTVAAADAAAGVLVACSFEMEQVSGATFAQPNPFQFYTGPTFPLVVDFTPAITFPGDQQPTVTITTNETASTQGFTLQVTCTLDGDANTDNIAVRSSTDPFEYTFGSNGFLLTFSAGSSTSSYYILQVSAPGEVVCTYGAISGEYLRFTAPAPTTLTSTGLVELVYSGETYSANAISGGTPVAVIPSSQSTAAVVLTPAAVLSVGLSIDVTLSCSYVTATYSTVSLSVSPSSFTFDSTTGTTPVTFTVTMPTTGTFSTPVGLSVTCTPSTSDDGFDTDYLHFAVGTAGRFNITSTEGFVSYRAASGATTLSTSVFTLVPSYCPGSGVLMIDSSCTSGGSLVFTATGSNKLPAVDASAFSTQNTFRYRASTTTVGDIDICTITIQADLPGIYFEQPPSFQITLVDRRAITFTGLDSSLTSGESVTASIYPTLPALSGGVTITVSCTSSGNAQQLLTPSASSFYFLEGDNTPQTFTVTAGSSFLVGSCSATASGDDYDSVTVAAGTLQTIIVPSAVTIDPCSTTTIAVTLSAASASLPLTVVVTCTSGSQPSISFAAGVTVGTFTYTALGYGLTDVCTFTVNSALQIYSTVGVLTTFIAGSGAQGVLTITSSPAAFTPSGSALAVVVQPSIRVPATLILNVMATASDGNTDEQGQGFTVSSLDPITITLDSETASAGSAVTWTYTYSLSGAGAAYFQVPPPSTFIIAPTNTLSGSLSQSTGLSSGQTVDVTFQLGSAAVVAFTADVQCRNVNTSAVLVSTSVSVFVGSVSTPSVPLLLGASTRAVYLVECDITPTGSSATLITSTQSVSFSFTGVPAAVSSTGSAGSAGGAGGVATGSTAGSSTGGCTTCDAIGAASVPSILLYAALITVAIAANRN